MHIAPASRMEEEMGQLIDALASQAGTASAAAGTARELRRKFEQYKAAVREQADAARLVRESEQRFRLLMEHASDIIFRHELAPTFSHTYISPAVQRMTGYTPEDYYSHPGLGLAVVHPEDRHVVEPFIRGMASGPGVFTMRFLHKDGHVVWTEQTVVPIVDEKGKLVAVEGVARDITERKRMEEELRESRDRLAVALEDVKRAKEEAEAANRAKDRFLAVLSHELRTPLAPVLTTAQLVEGSPKLPPELRESLSVIRRNAELEARLIDDLLDLSRIARGKLELQLQPVDLHEELQHVVETCDGGIRAKELMLVVKMEASRSWVQGDAARLQQIMWNLLKNAIKFTPAGGEIIICTANHDEHRLSVIVTDTGIGIEPEVLSRVFNAFEQGGQAITRHFGGLGLGLAIARALAEAHGGTLTASSEGKGRGATFTLELPAIARPAAAAPHPPEGTLRTETPKGGRLLLVEDHADTARSMSLLLQAFGYSVRTADSVASALQAAESEPFDLLLCDIGLPDGSGLDLMRQLRARFPIRAIALSGYGMEEDVRNSREAGFLAHLVKPINLQRLEEALREACH